MPERSIVRGFKGVLDFYFHFGVPCVRSWPKWYLTTRAPAVAQRANIFRLTVQQVATSSPLIVNAAKKMVRGTPQTWKDLLMALALGNENNAEVG